MEDMGAESSNEWQWLDNIVHQADTPVNGDRWATIGSVAWQHILPGLSGFLKAFSRSLGCQFIVCTNKRRLDFTLNAKLECPVILIPFNNSLRPNNAYMRRWNRPTLIHIITCRPGDAKPLSKRRTTCHPYWLLGTWINARQISSGCVASASMC